MEILDVNTNTISGPVPLDLGQRMTNLRWINLGYNSLGTGGAGDLRFIDSLTNCTELQNLAIYANGFGGVLPDAIVNLSTQLNQFLAGGNQFVGSIPSSITNFVNLATLGLESNYFSGTILFDIGKLKDLQILSLGTNELSGAIPSSIGNLTRLFELSLEENNFTGSIHWSIDNITGLQSVNLSYNSFVGSIPKAIGGLSSLSSLNLAHNSFIDALPEEIGKLQNLEVLDLSENKWSGGMPNNLGHCLRLEQLYLEDNTFQGQIPSSFSSLKGIVDLDLSRNNLSGQIPVDLEKLMLLKNLNLSFNNLQGEVPSEGVFKNISIVSLQGNLELCGGIPELRLSACPLQKTANERHNLAFRFEIIAPVVVVSITLAALLVFLYRKRKSEKTFNSQSSVEEEFLRVSYNDLLKATDGFSLTNLIGNGSFGTVYKGILHQDEKLVAVKGLNLEQLGASKSFIAECEALRNTRHRKNLLKLITACSSVDHEGNDFKALVFEFMPNRSLEDWLHPRGDASSQSRNLSLAQRLSIAIDVASALYYLHNSCERPIIHSDLKPSNVLLNEDMTANVGDFRLVKFLAISGTQINRGHTESTVIKGSIGYIAPEYALGRKRSKAGDVYSYGILLLEMLTGKGPTDDMFVNGLSLYEFSKRALPEQVMEIVDPRLLLEESNVAVNNTENQEVREAKQRECLISLVRIGVACSAESPGERMDIKDALK
ncbi:unnamed protein product [Ilex paraguariensis]|uniref:non-specific serine/threonine protein kinase n=1 Tax=Ilex paraguariensis TaxID=185542 RepID=A0ABC8QSP8_9AQUA